jgi:hypothetical protein
MWLAMFTSEVAPDVVHDIQLRDAGIPTGKTINKKPGLI